MPFFNDVVKDHSSVAVNGVNHFGYGPQGGNNERYAVFDTEPQVCFQARISRVHNQVDPIRSGFAPRFLFKGIQCCADLHQPLLKALAGALVQGWKRAHHPVLATFNDEFRIRNQKHRGRHNRQGKGVDKSCFLAHTLGIWP